MPIAVGTSLLIITANSAAGVALHDLDATITWSLTAAFVAFRRHPRVVARVSG